MNPLRQQFLPPCVRTAPEPVTEANAAAEEATATVERAATEMNAAQAEAKGATSDDTAAALAAVREGKPAPKATEPAKREALERSQRTFQAAKDEAEEAMRNRDRVVREALQRDDNWINSQHEVTDELLAEIDGLAEQLAAGYERLGDQSAVLNALYRRRELAREGRIPKSPNQGRWDRRKAVGRSGRRARPDGSFESFGEPVRPDPDSLLTALAKTARELVPERDDPQADEHDAKREAKREEMQRWRSMLEPHAIYPGR